MDADYLKGNVGNSLSAGLAAIARLRPADPVEFLGRFLLKWVDDEERREDWGKLAEDLEKERLAWLEKQRKEEEARKLKEKEMLDRQALVMADIKIDDTKRFEEFNNNLKALEAGTLKVETIRHFSWKKTATRVVDGEAESDAEEEEEEEGEESQEKSANVLDPQRKMVKFASNILGSLEWKKYQEILDLEVPSAKFASVLRASCKLLGIEPAKKRESLEDWTVLIKYITENDYRQKITSLDIERKHHTADKVKLVAEEIDGLVAKDLEDQSFVVFMILYWIRRVLDLRAAYEEAKATDAFDDALESDDE